MFTKDKDEFFGMSELLVAGALLQLTDWWLILRDGE